MSTTTLDKKARSHNIPKDLLKWLYLATSTDQTRTNINGVMLKDGLIAGTDGRRLHYIKFDALSALNYQWDGIEYFWPNDYIKEQLKGTRKDKFIRLDPKPFTQGLPMLENVIPEKFKHFQLLVRNDTQRDLLIDFCKMVKDSTVRIDRDGLKVIWEDRAQVLELNQSYPDIPEGVTIKLNAAYLWDILAGANSMAVMEFNPEADNSMYKAVKFVIDDAKQAVLMPMR